MKSLELTPEHKTKLLEMCEALFPKQSPFQIGIPGELRKGWGYSKHFIFGKSDVFADDGVFCHWFEFCMTHLLLKLSYEFSKVGSLEKNLASCVYANHSKLVDGGNGIHTIDYLYNEFKKLNL